MITKLLNEVNEKIETLNNLVQDKEYFKKLDERIEKANNYIQKQQQEIERLNNIIDKAIEYIDWQRRNPQYDNVWRNAECEDLIEILRGDK